MGCVNCRQKQEDEKEKNKTQGCIDCCQSTTETQTKISFMSQEINHQVIDSQLLNGIKLILENGKIWNYKSEAILNIIDRNMNNKHSLLISRLGPQIYDKKELNNQSFVEYGQVVKSVQKTQVIIHLSIPIWKGGNQNEIQILEQGLQKVYAAADSLKIASLSLWDCFTQYFGYPLNIVSKVILISIYQYGQENPQRFLNSIQFVEQNQCILNYIKQDVQIIMKNQMIKQDDKPTQETISEKSHSDLKAQSIQLLDLKQSYLKELNKSQKEDNEELESVSSGRNWQEEEQQEVQQQKDEYEDEQQQYFSVKVYEQEQQQEDQQSNFEDYKSGGFQSNFDDFKGGEYNSQDEFRSVDFKSVNDNEQSDEEKFNEVNEEFKKIFKMN